MTNDQVHRIDKFAVPAAVLDEFLDGVRQTHRILDHQPGLLRNDVTVLAGGASEFNVVTVVTWESEAAMNDARIAATADAQRRGVDRAAFIERLGVTGDLGVYRAV